MGDVISLHCPRPCSGSFPAVVAGGTALGSSPDKAESELES